LSANQFISLRSKYQHQHQKEQADLPYMRKVEDCHDRILRSCNSCMGVADYRLEPSERLSSNPI
jgi:hypothetical protein